MRWSMCAAAFLALVVHCEAFGQDYSIESGGQGRWILVSHGDQAPRRVRELHNFFGGELLSGERWGLAAATDPVTLARGLYFYDLRNDVAGFVPGVRLEGMGYMGGSDFATIAIDDRRLRAFVWHGARISAFDGYTLGLDDLLTAEPVWTGFPPMREPGARLLAYAPDAGWLLVRRANPVDQSPEVAVFDVASRTVVRHIPGWVSDMVVDRAGHFLVSDVGGAGLRLVDLTTGAAYASERPADLVPSLGVPRSRALLDAVRQHVIVPVAGGFRVFDLQLREIAALRIPDPSARRTFAELSAASGRLYLAWDGGYVSYFGPGSCQQAVIDGDRLIRFDNLPVAVGASDALGRSVPRFHSTPARPGTPTAAVAGSTVTLDWSAPGHASDFVVEAGLAPGRTDARIGTAGINTLVVPSVPPGRYYVRVRAMNELGAGGVSDEILVTVP